MLLILSSPSLSYFVPSTISPLYLLKLFQVFGCCVVSLKVTMVVLA